MPPEHQVTGQPSPDTDIAIIGAGIVGVACALALSRQGWRVTVLDKQAPGMGASYGNAGHMATEQVFPIADASILAQLPKMLLDPMGPLRLDWRHFPKALPWFVRLLWNLRKIPYQQSVSGIRSLNEGSLAAWHRLLASIGQERLLKAEGSFLIYEREDSLQPIKALQARMQEQKVPVEYWPGEAIRQVAPQLSDDIKGGLFFPKTGHVVNPSRIVEVLVEASKKHGVVFEQDEVLSATAYSQNITLSTCSRKLSAKKVLVACGAHSAPLTEALTGIKVPLDTERGYHLMLPQERERLPVAVTSFERRFIMTPMEEGLRLAGTVEFAGLIREANMQRAWQLHRLSQGLFKTEIDTTSATPWMGFRPSLPDSLPIIDCVKDRKVLLAFGHHHLGLTQAALTAEIIASLAADDTEAFDGSPTARPDLQPYKLERFA